MTLSSIESVRKSCKWYKKLFIHFLDLFMLNTHAMYKHVTEKKTISLAAIHLEVMTNVSKIQQLRIIQGSSMTHSRKTFFAPSRKTFFKKVLRQNSTGRQPVRHCVLCSKRGKRSDSTYKCDVCNVGLCPTMFWDIPVKKEVLRFGDIFFYLE